jgi:hypothetical protein
VRHQRNCPLRAHFCNKIGQQLIALATEAIAALS